MVLYVNHLQEQNWWPECAIIIILNTAMGLTCKNQGFHYDSGDRIKSWNFRSAPNIIIHILKNQVNSYDSNSVIAVLYLLWGMRNRTCHFSVYLFFLGIPWTYWVILYIIGKIFSRRIQHHWNSSGKWFRIDREIPETSFTNINLGGRWSLEP